MLSNDKLALGALNVTVATGLYWLGNQRLSTAMTSPVGGMAASTLFQLYHENFSSQLRKTCGDQVYKIIAWSYPSIVILGCYLGKLAVDVNLLVSGIFIATQFLGTLLTTAYQDDMKREEIQRLSKEVYQAIDKKDLSHAETLVTQMSQIWTDRSRLCGFGILESEISSEATDRAKLKLVSEFLSQTPPSDTQAETWVDLIIDPFFKAQALYRFSDLLSQPSSDQTKLKNILAKYQQLLGQLDEKPIYIGGFLAFKLRYGDHYKDRSATQETQDYITSLKPTKHSFEVLSRLFETLKTLEEPILINACLEKALQCLDSDSNWNKETEGKILSLVEIAVDAKSIGLAERFTKHSLTGMSRIKALIKLAEGYQENHDVDKAKQAAQEAVDDAFKQCPDKVIPAIKAQMEIDCKAAYDSANRLEEHSKDWVLLSVAIKAFLSDSNLGETILSELEGRFDSLSSPSKLALMELQAERFSDRVFEQFQKHQHTWEQESPDFHCLALTILAKKHLNKKELDLGKQRILEIEDFLLKSRELPKNDKSLGLLGDSFHQLRKATWNRNCAEIGKALVELNRQVKALEAKWFFQR